MIRMIFTVFGYQYSFSAIPLGAVLIALAVAGMFVASWIVMCQVNQKRMLAWSSIALVAYMIFGLGLVTVAGLTATFIDLFNHALMNAALIMALGSIFYFL